MKETKGQKSIKGKGNSGLFRHKVSDYNEEGQLMLNADKWDFFYIRYLKELKAGRYKLSFLDWLKTHVKPVRLQIISPNVYPGREGNKIYEGN